MLSSSKQSANRRQQNFEAHRSADPLLQTLFQATEMVARRHIHSTGTKALLSMVNLCPSHPHLNISNFALVFRMQSNTMVLCFLLGFRVPHLAVLSFLCFSDAWGLVVAGIPKLFLSFFSYASLTVKTSGLKLFTLFPAFFALGVFHTLPCENHVVCLLGAFQNRNTHCVGICSFGLEIIFFTLSKCSIRSLYQRNLIHFTES